MRRLALTAAALVAATATLSAASVATGRSAPLASAYVSSCYWGSTSASRYAVFTGAMRRIRGTRRMGMLFRLYKRRGDGRFEAVRVRGLGVWRMSRPWVSTFRYRQRVQGLSRGTAYRMRVAFRWYARNGSIILRSHRWSGICSEPLPNLKIGSVLQIGAQAYRVKVLNTGSRPARDVRLSFAVDGSPQTTTWVGYIAARSYRTVDVSGPVCLTGVTAVVDPAGAIRESSENDNRYSASCEAITP